MDGGVLMVLTVLLPSAGALALWGFRGASERGRNTAVCEVTALEFLLVLLMAFAGTEGARLSADAVCGLGISFKSDGFRILYAGLAAFLWMVTSLFSGAYFAGHENQGRYYIFTLLTLAASEGLFFSGDFGTAFLFFELLSLTSYVWVAQEETKEALRAADTYLAIAVFSGLTLLMGLFLLYARVHSLEFGALSGALDVFSGDRGVLYAAGACLFAGFGAKAGCFPLHVWLPKAHAAAPAPASALLSGILTKAGVFGVLLTTVYLFAGDPLWGGWLLALGAVTMVLGAVLAVFSTQLKRTFACSSMSQIGFILVGIGTAVLCGEENELAVRGTILHMVNHSLLKLLLFLAAGVVFMNLGKLEFDEIRGFGRKKPFLLFAYLMGALGISGVPGWNGYVSKTLLHEGILEMKALIMEAGGSAAGASLLEAAFLVSGGLTAAYMMKVFFVLFVDRHPERQQEFDRMADSYLDRRSRAALGISAVLPLALGVLPHAAMDRIADFGRGFLGNWEELRTVAYFSPESLKGAAISLGIGALVYLTVVRLWMTRRENGVVCGYVNRWPWWLDLENSVYRPVFFTALPTVCTFFCRVMDHALDAGILLARRTTHRQTRERYKRLDGDRAAYLLGVACDDVMRVFRRRRGGRGEREERSAIPKMVELEEMFLKTAGIFGMSLSFSLMLVCLGLCLTLLYLIL